VRARALIQHVEGLRELTPERFAARIAESARGVGRSQLGLARVQLEARMDLSVDQATGKVRTTARGRV
jgi:hypothetical protein